MSVTFDQARANLAEYRDDDPATVVLDSGSEDPEYWLIDTWRGTSDGTPDPLYGGSILLVSKESGEIIPVDHWAPEWTKRLSSMTSVSVCLHPSCYFKPNGGAPHTSSMPVVPARE